MRLYNEQIRLIPYEPEMWPHIYAWQHSGEYDYFFGNIPAMNSHDINNTVNSSRIVFLVVNASNVKEIIGIASITDIQERHRNAHFGVLIDSKYQKKTIGQQVAILLMDYALNQMNLYKMICRITDANENSLKAVAKIGMVKEAELKYDVYHDGAFKDVHRYCMTKSNFNKLHRKSGKVESAIV